MWRGHKNNRSPPRNLPASSRMHFSKEEVDEDTKCPQEDIVDPVRHRVHLLVQRLPHPCGRLGANAAIGVRVDGVLRLTDGRHGCLCNEANARSRVCKEYMVLSCDRRSVVVDFLRVLSLGLVRSLACSLASVRAQRYLVSD